MTQIALIIGHDAKERGAIRITDGMTEYDFNTRLAEAIRATAPSVYKIIKREAGVGYTTSVRRAYAQADALGVKATVELHFNSAAAASATGTETLTSGTRGSIRLADHMQHHMLQALGLRNRGLKVVSRSDRGGESLWAGRAPAVLIEPFFGSNADDCAVVDRKFLALARSISTACQAYLKEI